jgi:hypothetical protein
MEMEANARCAMREGLTALAELRGPHAVDELSLPAMEIAVSNDEQVKAETVVDDRPWRVDPGSNATEGFFVYGFKPSTLLSSGWEPSMHGPYSTLEDAEAVVAAKDPAVRPRDEELMRREEEENGGMDSPRNDEEQPPPPGD